MAFFIILFLRNGCVIPGDGPPPPPPPGGPPPLVTGGGVVGGVGLDNILGGPPVVTVGGVGLDIILGGPPVVTVGARGLGEKSLPLPRDVAPPPGGPEGPLLFADPYPYGITFSRPVVYLI